MKTLLCICSFLLLLSSVVSGQNTIGVKVFLEGALVNPVGTNIMRVDLQTKGLLPTASTTAYPSDPVTNYSSINNPGGPAGAIVDWVRISLRDAANPAAVIETADFLLRNDGNVVTTSGSTSLPFSSPSGNYFVSVEHRNHLGVMTATTYPLASSPNSNVVDFSLSSTANFGTSASAALNAQSTLVGSGIRSLWAGNVEKSTISGKQVIYYAASPSDVDLIRAVVQSGFGNTQHQSTFTGASVSNLYSVFDVNLDGNIRYAVSPSDVDLARSSVQSYPNNILHLTAFIGNVQQLP